MQQKATLPIVIVAVVVLVGLLVFMYSKFFAPSPAGSTPPPKWVQDLQKGGAKPGGPPNTGGTLGSGPGGGRPGSMGGSMGMGGTMGGSTSGH